jgi:dTDP-4-dehydrorhamnose reductase
VTSASSAGDGLTLETTPIPGLVVLRLVVHEDGRGWFKENWQREKMVALGLPDFGPVQNNVSFNAQRGATRGIHTEPWDKYVSVANGRAFAAWVDMREGETFGATFHIELNPATAVFVPRGVGNSYQTLEDGVSYTYLVNEHYRPGIAYPALHLGDPTAAIPWPIPLAESEISEKDHRNPTLDAVTPMRPKKTLITGAKGQLGRALQTVYPEADLVDIDELDLTDPDAVAAWPWHEYAVVLNAAAYTAVDAAETPEGRVACWAANAAAPAVLARIADEHHLTLVHYSSDYVFDGTADEHTEDEPFSPLGVYAQAKAAGDIAVATARRHYVLRTSWVIGDGRNFVRTMQTLAANGVSPTVVADQVGRLTFTDELARATCHLLGSGAAYGTYNVSNGGPAMSWHEIAAAVFERSGRSAADVTPCTTEEYAAGKDLAPRPATSTLSLAKIEATGFTPADAMDALDAYLADPSPNAR